MRWIVTAAIALLCSPAFAQQAAVMPTPSLSATSPLGMVPSAPVGGTGIPLGATEITSPGVSPMPLPSSGIVGSTVCSTVGTAPSTMFGSAASFDGGGMAVGTVAPQSMMQMSSSGISPTSALIDTSGSQSMCGAGASNTTASSAPTSPTTPGGVPRTGIPMGSTEIGNLGVSSAAAVPIVTVAPTIASVTPAAPAVTLSAPSTTAVPATGNLLTGMPSISGITSSIPALSPGATLTP
jgi:hypothetical protein